MAVWRMSGDYWRLSSHSGVVACFTTDSACARLPHTHQIANDLEVCDLPALANEYTAPRVPTKPDRNSYPTYKWVSRCLITYSINSWHSQFDKSTCWCGRETLFMTTKYRKVFVIVFSATVSLQHFRDNVTLNPLIATLKPQSNGQQYYIHIYIYIASYSNTARREPGGAAAHPGPSSLYQM